MMVNSYLSNQFLIAMPALEDPNFSHTVSYICEHTPQGAMGVVINRPTELVLGDLLEQLDIEAGDEDIARIPVYHGGPVQLDRGFILHEPIGDWDSTLSVSDDIGLTMSQDIIEAIAHGMGPKKFHVALGYAGWDEGQLEEELLSNAWLTGPADKRIVFDEPVERRWQAAAASLGIELNLLSSDVGHA
ncbi:MAG: YqgE/AlgH family protein [Thioalkalispiraceae bacterium]